MPYRGLGKARQKGANVGRLRGFVYSDLLTTFSGLVTDRLGLLTSVFSFDK